MGRGFKTCAQVLVACLAAGAVGIAVPQHALGQLDAKRAQAAALQTRIEQQGRELSMADEAYNQARIDRQRIEVQASSARGLVKAADNRWVELKAQLSRRVRLLYMHPGAALDAYLSQDSLADLERARKFGASVLTADNDLVMATERARQEVMARARHLDGIRDAAQGKERELASRRADVSGAVAGQRALLGKVKGEIADLMEAQRKAELEAARQPTSSSSGDDPNRGRIIGGVSGGVTPDEEPTGPPPPVKGGAGTAVSAAAAQIGKPYEWAADGPDSFDCSGLTMFAWSKAGVSMPHSSGAQYSSLPHVGRAHLRAGDLVFFGSPIHHVGIYEGGGVMINAPETGENVRRDSIARADYAGAARP
jgi:cell wall-associated NlpC family hydrolase